MIDPRSVKHWEGETEYLQRQIKNLRETLSWIVAQRWNEDADLDEICTRAEKALSLEATLKDKP